MTEDLTSAPVVLHVGTPKTGTTSIQWALRAAEAELEEQGVWYPHLHRFAPEATLASHWDVVTAAEDPGRSRLGHDGFARFVDELRRRRTTHRTVISAEQAWLPPVTGISYAQRARLLADVLGDGVHVVVYLRRQSDYLVSYFNTHFRTHRLPGASLEEAFVRFVGTVDNLDYRAMLEDLGATFGPDRIHVRVADRRELVDNDAVADFCTLLGIATVDAVDLPIEDNAAASLSVLRAKQVLDTLPGVTQEQAARAVLDIYRTTPERWRDPDHQCVRRWCDLDAIDDAHTDGNRWIARTYLDREELFPAPVDRDIPALPDPEVTAQLLAAALVRLSEADHQRRLAQRRRRLEAAAAGAQT